MLILRQEMPGGRARFQVTQRNKVDDHENNRNSVQPESGSRAEKESAPSWISFADGHEESEEKISCCMNSVNSAFSV